MTLADILFLSLVIGSFALYGLVLFRAWLTTGLIGRRDRAPR